MDNLLSLDLPHLRWLDIDSWASQADPNATETARKAIQRVLNVVVVFFLPENRKHFPALAKAVDNLLEAARTYPDFERGVNTSASVALVKMVGCLGLADKSATEGRGDLRDQGEVPKEPMREEQGVDRQVSDYMILAFARGLLEFSVMQAATKDRIRRLTSVHGWSANDKIGIEGMNMPDPEALDAGRRREWISSFDIRGARLRFIEVVCKRETLDNALRSGAPKLLKRTADRLWDLILGVELQVLARRELGANASEEDLNARANVLSKVRSDARPETRRSKGQEPMLNEAQYLYVTGLSF